MKIIGRARIVFGLIADTIWMRISLIVLARHFGVNLSKNITFSRMKPAIFSAKENARHPKSILVFQNESTFFLKQRVNGA
jgi:hypothetical protein